LRGAEALVAVRDGLRDLVDLQVVALAYPLAGPEWADNRRLLRTHELGHALGFNHVKSRVSIMNPRIGPEVTAFDRQVAMLAFPASISRPAQ